MATCGCIRADITDCDLKALRDGRVRYLVARCRKENDLFICEYRMLTFNNFVKWIRDEAVIVLSDAGEPLFIQSFIC